MLVIKNAKTIVFVKAYLIKIKLSSEKFFGSATVLPLILVKILNSEPTRRS